MSLTPEAVAEASSRWLWYPDEAEVVDTDDFLLVNWPSWFAAPPNLMRVDADADLTTVLAAVDEQVRAWGHEKWTGWVKLDAPDDLEPILRDRGTPDETLDVLALDLSAGAPSVDVPHDIEVGWRNNLEASRDFVTIGIEAFEEGTVPDDDVLLAHAEESEADRRAGRGGQMLAYRHGDPIGAAGITLVDGVGRLWGGSVVPEARRRGAYRALLAARLEYAVEHGAHMALVKGRVETSGPVLRRVGFEPYGQERSYVVSVAASGLD